MTTFKKGTWIYDGDDSIAQVQEDGYDWHPAWKELANPPDLTLKPKTKYKVLSEATPEVGMVIRHRRHNYEAKIMLVRAGNICVDLDGNLRVVSLKFYESWEVVEEPHEESTEEPQHTWQDAPIAASLACFGWHGRWLQRNGSVITGRPERRRSDTFPVEISGHAFKSNGGYSHNDTQNGWDIVKFLGWGDRQ